MVKCSCDMIMMHRVYKEHRCAKALFKPIKRQKINDNGAGQGDSEASNEGDSQGYSGTSGSGDDSS